MRKLIALFLIVVLVFPLTLATLTAISVSTWVLDRSFYEDLLGDTRLYEVMLSEDLPNYFNRRFAREFDSDLPVAALGKALREVVTPEYLRDQATRIVDQTFDALEGQSATLDLYLDMAPIKAALRGDGGWRFAQALAAELPVCAAGQDEAVAEGAIMPCRPADTSVDEVAALIAAGLPAYLDRVPDRLNLARERLNLPRGLRGGKALMLGTEALNLAIVLLVVIAGGCWVVAALIGGSDRRERILWLGWSLIVPAALIFLIGLAINTDFSLGWVRSGLNEARFEGLEYSESFRLAVLDVSRTALSTVANGFLAAGGVAGAIALALIAWGWGMPPERPMAPMAAARAAPQPQQPPAQVEPPAGSTGA